MKKLYTLILVSGVAFGTAYAQKSVSPVSLDKNLIPERTKTAERSTRDTLYYDNFYQQTGWAPTLYTSVDANQVPNGFVAGNNAYGDKQKTQAFAELHPGNAHKVEAAILWIGLKRFNSGNNNAKVVVRVHQLNGNGTLDGGPTSTAPGTVLATADLLLSNIDTSGFNPAIVNFSPAPIINANQNYAISLDVSTLANGDTVALVTSSAGEVLTPEQSFEQWSSNAWYSMLAGWGIDLTMFMEVAIDNNTTSVAELAQNEMLLNAFPNPTSNFVSISYSLGKESNVIINIADITGKVVASINEGTKAMGSYITHFNTSELSAGTYFYSVVTENGTATKKLVVTK